MISCKMSVSEIRNISSIVIDNITEHDRDEMAIPSYLHANPLIRWLMWQRYEVIAGMLPSSSNTSALEFGCGIGLFLSELRNRYSKVYAIDLFPQYAMELARRNGLDITFVKNLDELPDHSLDVIVAADVLEHIENLDEYLRIFHTKLKPEGQFIVSGPTENIFYKLGRYAAGFGDKGDYHHTNINKLIQDITGYGFKLVEEKSLPFDYLPSLFKICRFINF